MTHKSEDYKISAVKYYLNNKDNIRKTCKMFDCKKSTLQHDGYKDIIILKILQEEIGKMYPIRLLKHK